MDSAVAVSRASSSSDPGKGGTDVDGDGMRVPVWVICSVVLGFTHAAARAATPAPTPLTCRNRRRFSPPPVPVASFAIVPSVAFVAQSFVALSFVIAGSPSLGGVLGGIPAALGPLDHRHRLVEHTDPGRQVRHGLL